MDFTISATFTGSTITVVKQVKDIYGNTIDLGDNTATYTVYLYDATENDDDTGNDELEQTLSLAVSGDDQATTVISGITAGDYYVVESDNYPTSVKTADGTTLNYSYTEVYYVTDTYDTNGDLVEDGTTTSETVKSLTSGKAEVDSYHTATFYVVNYYGEETVDVTVNKNWDPEEDTYDLRDDVTVTLYQNGNVYTDSNGNDVTGTLTEAGNWTYTFTGLPKSDSSGTDYTYTVVENAIDGYTNTTSTSTTDDNGNVTIELTNKLNVGQLSLTKVVNADEKADLSDYETFLLYVSGFGDVTEVYDTEGNPHDVQNGTATVYVAPGATVTLVNVPAGTYTVTEAKTTTTWYWSTTGEGDYTVTAGTTTEAEITNTLHYTGDINLHKTWDDSSNAYGSRPESITVTLTSDDATDGETYTYSMTTWTASGDSWSTTLSGVEFYDGNGNAITYTVTETLNYANGASTTYTYTTTYAISSTGTGAEEADFTYTPAPDYDGRNLYITNTLDTTTVSLSKVVLDADGTELTTADNQDDFRFVLYTYVDGTAVQIGEAQTISAGGTAEWTNVPLNTELYLTEVMVGEHRHSYDTTLTLNGTALDVTENYGYVKSVGANAKTHTVTFTLTEDGTFAIVVTNKEEEVSADLSALVNGSKTLKIADDAELEGTLTFTYSVYEGQTGANTLVATGTATTSSTKTESDITWTVLDKDAFTYSEVGTYTYTIVEDVTSTGGVVYDSTRYTLTITVEQDNGGGGLVATATMTKNAESQDGTSREISDVTSDGGADSIVVDVADAENSTAEVSDDTFTASFTNEYDPSEASIILRAVKTLTGGTLKAEQFSVDVTEYTDATYKTTGDVDDDGNITITRSNGANGYMGYEIIYDQDHAGFGNEAYITGESDVTETTDTTAGTTTQTKTVTFSRTYYYTVKEVIPSEATAENNYTVDGVTYTTVTYYIMVTVSANAEASRISSDGGETWDAWVYEQDGDVYISEAVYTTDLSLSVSDWNDLYDADGNVAILDFTNTYEAEGTGTLSTYKVLYGRSFVDGETLTFTITALDSAAPILVDSNGNELDYKTVTDSSGTEYKVYTVTVTVDSSTATPVEDSDKNVLYYVLKTNLATIYADEYDVGTWTYRVNETGASFTSGMTLDSAEYGRLITVTVTDSGSGTLEVTTSSTNDTDWDGNGTTDTTASVIANTFNSGSVTLYGAKNWVDGSTSHDNENEIELAVWSSIDNGATWKEVGSSAYTLTWYNNGEWQITGLPEYDSATGIEFVYKVVETSLDGYVTTYSNNSQTYSGNGYTRDSRYTITNTIEQEYIFLSGTKTWVDAEETDHDNASEVTLTVTRNNDSLTSAVTLTQVTGDGTGEADTYIVVWNGDSYAIYWYYDEEAGTYRGLPMYDANGYTNKYSVTESVDGYTSETSTVYGETNEDGEYLDIQFNFINRAPDEEGETPVKTETTITDADTEETTEATTTDTDFSSGSTVTYDEVAVGDTITYSVSYYNNTNTTATITITDALDSGVDYVDGSATDGGVYSETTHTITWTLSSVAAFEDGTVTFSVTVNENAKNISSGETDATVVNQASVKVGNSSAVSTNIVENPLEDDEVSYPYKVVEINDGTFDYADDLEAVEIGDYIRYRIYYTNYTSSTQTITIVDKLDDGVTYDHSTQSGVYNSDTHTVTWTITNVAPFTSSYVTVFVQVADTAKARSSKNDYDVKDVPEEYQSGDYNYAVTFGTGNDTTASVSDQASVTIGTDNEYEIMYTNVTDNPLTEDEEETPYKIETAITTSDSTTTPTGSVYNSETEETKDLVNTVREGHEADDDTVVCIDELTETDTVTYNDVSVGDIITYSISYYNHYNTTATITITDELDDGVTYVTGSATQGGVYNETTRTITWTLTAEPLSSDTVTFQVRVNANAENIEDDETAATVENSADVTVTSTANTENTVSWTTDTVVNPLEDDDPVDPVKTESGLAVSDDSKATVDSDGNVVTDGEISDATVTYESVSASDIVTYNISYYNNYSTTATVTITDVLDKNVTFISASGVLKGEATETDTIVYELSTDEDGITTVTWNLTVDPLTGGTVTLQVQVLSGAVDATSISNQASVKIGNDSAVDTNTVENPVDDEPGTPEKVVSADSEAGVNGNNVKVDDEITYEITYYNHNSEAATITIVDNLDPNVELVDATDQNNNSLYDGITGAARFLADSVAGKVTWTFTAEAYETGTVTITVRVKDGAQGGTVSNQASVQVGNDAAVDTNVSENPVDDDPKDPVKTETTINNTETADLDISGDTYTYEDVAVDDEITYTISYYNHYNTTATVTIEDELDEGVDFVSASGVTGDEIDTDAMKSVSDGGTANYVTYATSETNGITTVTWTIYNVKALYPGTVTLTVKVNKTAKITTGETKATVENDADVTITETDDKITNTTNTVVNPLVDDDPTDPTKKETTVVDSDGSSSDAELVDWDEEDDATYDTYGKVGVGDQITYEISYTNHMNGIATITITDELDEGVTFVSATGSYKVTGETTVTEEDGTTWKYGGTVTWTIDNVDPYGTGTVTLTVKVNENAKTTEDGETVATVENQATETNSLDLDDTRYTHVVVNPLEDDEPETPTKTLKVTYADETDEDTPDEYNNLYVHVGDTVTYSITYYNNLNEEADVVIADVLDEGVTFVSASVKGEVDGEKTGTDSDGNTYLYGGTFTYTARKVAPLTGGTITLTVTVNENAKASENTYKVNPNADSDYSLTYGVDGDTTASIANQASTIVVSATIGHQTTYYSNVVENPLEEDDPTEPEKTETEIAGVETTALIQTTDTYTYETVGVDEVIEYEISYYNNHNTQATITIVDTLDEGVDFALPAASPAMRSTLTR